MSDTTNTTENMEQVTEQEMEMQEAQASGVVNFDDKKKDKEEDGHEKIVGFNDPRQSDSASSRIYLQSTKTGFMGSIRNTGIPDSRWCSFL